jgi:hypothetical protein
VNGERQSRSVVVPRSSGDVLGATDRHWRSLRDLVTELDEPSANFFFDIHTAALMRYIARCNVAA